MTLHQLRIFRAVARHLNFTQAAQELHLSQPSVSMQIQQLEEELGVSLFEQVGKKVYLSEARKVLESYSYPENFWLAGSQPHWWSRHLAGGKNFSGQVYVHRVMAFLECARAIEGLLR